jgi:hypothetical protein
VPREAVLSAHDATPHQLREADLVTVPPTVDQLGVASGGWCATADDLVRLLLATDQLSNHPDILSAAALDTMETAPYSTAPNYALGWSYDADGKLGKDGGANGGSAYVAKVLSGYKVSNVEVGGINVALCANSAGAADKLNSLANTIAKAAAQLTIDADYDLY